MPRQSPPDRRATLLQRQKEIADKLKVLDAKDKAEARKTETHRKVVAGALALEHLEKNPGSEFAKTLTRLMDEYVKPHERHLFAFLKEKAAQAAE